MLEYQDARWANLGSAYGSAGEAVEILRLLDASPLTTVYSDPDRQGEEIFQDLFSAFCHSGTVFTGSYALVPHIVRIGFAAAKLEPEDGLPYEYFQLPGMIEFFRRQNDGQPEIPDFLLDSYKQALHDLHDLAHLIAKQTWSDGLGRAVGFALAVERGNQNLLGIFDLEPF